jgi:hypothetical protein
MKTEELMQNWIRARKGRERAEAIMAQAQDEEAKAVNEMGAWLCPADAKIGEPFHVWIGSGILQVFLLGDVDSGNYKVQWRKEPDGKDRLEKGF